MIYDQTNRVTAMTWWNNLTALQKSEYSLNDSCCTGREIEKIYWKHHPTDTTIYKDFDEFYSHHPYQKNLCYTEEDWKIEMYTQWSKDNGYMPEEMYGEEFKKCFQEPEISPIQLLIELWDWTKLCHPWLAVSASPESLFGKVKAFLADEKVFA